MPLSARYNIERRDALDSERIDRAAMDGGYEAYAKAWIARLAPYYGIFDALVRRVRSVVVDVANAPRGARVLDVATGTGAQAFAFANRGHVVDGIDFSEEMLSIARRHNTRGTVSFRHADATRLPFEDGAFDVVCISFALHDMPPAVRACVLAEMARVSRLNGTVMIVEYAVPPQSTWHALVLRLARWGETTYFPSFIGSDFRGLVARAGINIEREIAVLMGFGRITRAININAPGGAVLTDSGEA